ncbi:MAG TPA: terminase family protein [Allosphingosinicella sp.]
MIADLPARASVPRDFEGLLGWIERRFDGDRGDPPLEYKSFVTRSGRTWSRAEMLQVLDVFIGITREQRLVIFRSLPEPAVRALADEWFWQAHGGQIEPKAAPDGEPWRVWAIVAARGFGKTRAGAEWVWARAREDGRARIALVAATIDEVVRVMIEGESGLLGLARSDERPRWIPSKRLLRFPSGAEAHVYSAERPEALRGPQHHFAWCDELAKWPRLTGTGQSKAGTAWDNLMLGLRLGDRPRTIVTTTPRPGPLLKRVLALPRCAVTHGRTDENPHLPGDFREAMREMYGGTRLGRQELEGLLLEEFEGALWTRDLLERARFLPPHAQHGEGDLATPGGGVIGSEVMDSRENLRLGAVYPSTASGGPPPHLPMGRQMRRIIIGLDPPASTGGDSCGIIVCGKDDEGAAWVLADLTAAGLTPEAWARRVAEAAAQYGAGKIVAEKNQGGDMIASVLRAVDYDLPVKLVAATRSKAARAEPIALRFETGRARLAGHFPELEDQLCALTWSGYQGPGSPDRADAMVWAMTELFEKERSEPRVRRL